MSPDYIRIIISASGALLTAGLSLLLLILRLRDSKVVSDTKVAIYELKEDFADRLAAMKDELNSKFENYVRREESDKMHSENKESLGHIQRQLDEQGKSIQQIIVDLAKRSKPR